MAPQRAAGQRRDLIGRRGRKRPGEEEREKRGEERKRGEGGDLCSGHPNGLTPGRCTPPCKQGTVLVLTSPVTVHARYLKEMLAPTNGG